MANLLQTIRAKAPSTRAMLAIGGAAAIALGVVQTTDTLAADNDTSSATASQIATGNYLPVPVPTTMTCKNDGNPNLGGDADISWTNMGPQYKYRIEQWGNNDSLDRTIEQTASSYNNYTVNKTAYSFRLRIRTINIETGEISSGYVSWSLYTPVVWSAGCSSSFGQENVTNWQQTTDWTPQSPQSRSARSGRDAPILTSSTAPSASPSTDESEPSTAESTKTSAPTSESEVPSSTTTKAPSTSTEESTTPSVEEAKITYGVGIAGETKKLIIYKDGTEVCDFDMTEDDTPSINGNTVSVTTGGSVKTVNPKTCTLS